MKFWKHFYICIQVGYGKWTEQERKILTERRVTALCFVVSFRGKVSHPSECGRCSSHTGLWEADSLHGSKTGTCRVGNTKYDTHKKYKMKTRFNQTNGPAAQKDTTLKIFHLCANIQSYVYEKLLLLVLSEEHQDDKQRNTT